MAPAEPAAAGRAGNARRRASGFAVTVLCLLLAARISDVVSSGEPGQVPFTLALFVLPLACAVSGGRRLLASYRWPVLAVQGVLTWMPFAVFGGRWQVGIGGLLAGLVLLTVRDRAGWLLAGLLLVTELAVRAGMTGLPGGPALGSGHPQAWFGVLEMTAYYVDDALVFFGIVRLAQIVGEVEQARGQAADLAAAGERLRAARELHAAVGERLADIAAGAATARRVLSRDAAQARTEVAAAGSMARGAVAQARRAAAGDRQLARREPAGPQPAGTVIGARLAWAVVVGLLVGYAAANITYISASGYGGRLLTIAVGDVVLVVALQLYHSGAARQGRRPPAWPVTLAVQAMLVYAFAFPFIWAYVGFFGGFLAGSVLLLVPGQWRWAGYAAVVASFSALYAVLPVRAGFFAGQRIPIVLILLAAETAEVGLTVYALARLAGLARELEVLRHQLAWAAAMRERLRMARDVHDLLGLGLSAVALKADLAGALIGRDDRRAAAEMEEMARIAVGARADIRLVTGEGVRLCLTDELTAGRQILGSAGIAVSADVPPGPLPPAADEVLAPVLREAVTNILRHATATACVIEVTARDGMLRLRVSNDGATKRPPASPPAYGGGQGLANLDARVRAVGGRLASHRSGGRFDLIAEVPLDAPRLEGAEVPGRWRETPPSPQVGSAPGIDDPPSPGHRAGARR
jgi:two-component system sensor histidine kinase DesK